MQPEKPVQEPSPDPVTPASQPPQAPAPGKQQKRKFPVWAIITLSLAGFLALIGTLGAVVYSSFQNSIDKPTDEATTFVQAVQGGQITEAYDMTSSTFRNTTPPARFQALIDSAGDRLNGEATVTDSSVKTFRNATTAQVLMEIDGSPKTFLKVSMVKLEDGWKVNGVQFDDVPFQESLDN